MDLSKYIDSYGLIVQKLDGYSKGDGGDGAFRTSHYEIISNLKGNQTHSSFGKLIEYEKATPFIRHPDPSKWYSETNRFSRDQATPYIIALALNNDKKSLFHFFKHHAMHLFLFTWNTIPNWVMPNDPGYKRKLPDLTLFEFFNIYIRGFRLYPLYPLLLLGDLEMLLSCIVKRFDSDFDVNNSLASTLLAQQVMGTPLSYLARKILKPVTQKKLDKYWAPERMEPAFNELYKEIVDKM